MHLIIIEGGIASGKSTLTKNLAEKLNYKAFYEPVEQNPYLEKYYSDPKTYALEMQWWFLAHRFQMHREAINHIWKTGQSVIMDRSVYGDEVFACLNYEEGNITKEGWETYKKHRFVMFNYLMVPHYTIYLDVLPEICLGRIKNLRGRDCESNISLSYLQHLNDLNEELLINLQYMGSKVHKFNNDSFLKPEDVLNSIKLQPFTK